MYYDWGQLEIPQSSISRYSAVREMLESARTGPGTLLDVGTYTGQFIEYMSQNGWKVHGIEPNIEAAKAGRRAWGHEITVSDTSTAIELLKGRTFDAITFSHVLEHVSDLSEPFRLADLLLSSGGLLFIEVPDMGNMAPDYPGFFSIEHLSHFTIATVEHLAANRGYSVIRSENVSTGPDLDTELPVLRVVLTRTEKARVAQNLTPAELVDPITLSITELNIGRDTLVNKVRRILEEEQESKIAIWGAGFHTSLLLGLIPELSDIAVAIIDSDVR